MRTFSAVLLLLLVSAVALAETPQAEEVNLSAAASICDAVKVIGTRFEKSSGIKVLVNCGGSSALAMQIRAGAPVDLFFSADDATMDGVEVLPGTRRELLTNTLVVMASIPVKPGAPSHTPHAPPMSASAVASSAPASPRSAKDVPRLATGFPRSAADLPRLGRIAIADPSSVPAGVYARHWLEQLGLWDKIAPNVIPTADVRAALAAVDGGNVDAAIVYRTDAALAKHARIAFEVAGPAAPHIRYPLAIMRSARHPVAARRFWSFLQTEQTLAVFRRLGFTVIAMGDAANPR